jgi:hypothetical protein
MTAHSEAVRAIAEALWNTGAPADTKDLADAEMILFVLRELPVEQRMEAMGMTEVAVSFSYEEISTVGEGSKTIDTWPPDVEESRPLPLYADLAGHTFVEDRPEFDDGVG